MILASKLQVVWFPDLGSKFMRGSRGDTWRYWRACDERNDFMKGFWPSDARKTNWTPFRPWGLSGSSLNIGASWKYVIAL